MSAETEVQRLSRQQAARAFLAASLTVATVSIGLALADRIPESTPAYVSVVLSSLTLLLAGLAARLDALPGRGQWTGCSLHFSIALVGTCLTGCAWAGADALFPIVWTLVLTVAAGCSWIVTQLPDGTWIRQRNDPPTESLERSTTFPVAESLTVGAESLPEDGRCRQDLNGFDAAPPGSEVTQQMTRRQTGDEESVEIIARVEFQAGQQHASLHLPISPALAEVPDVECEPVDDAELEVQVGAALPYGIRLDARRAGNSLPACETEIAILLRARRHRQAA